MKKSKKKCFAPKVAAGAASSQSSNERDCSHNKQGQTRQRRRRSIRIRNLISAKGGESENVYDGDVENNSDSSCNQESKCSQSLEVYDFDLCENELDDQLDHSINKTKISSPTSQKKTAPMRKVSSARSASKRPHAVGNCENARKKLRSTKSQNAAEAQKFGRTKTMKRNMHNTTADSGIFMTPPSLCTSGTPAEKAAPVSAASSTPCGRMLSTRGKNRGGVLQPLATPTLSPVQSLVRQSDVRGQLVTSQTSLLEDDSVFDYEPPTKKRSIHGKQLTDTSSNGKSSLKKSATVDLLLEAKKPKTSKKQRYEASVSKAREFDEKMSREFEEIEKFTLNIDDI